MSTLVTLVGTPFSTFTRAISMGLLEKGIAFDQVPALPHSDDAKAHHPMGRIPSFCHGGFWLFESLAISRYIDASFPSSAPLRSQDTRAAAIEDQWASFIADYAFSALEHGLIKVRLAASTDASDERYNAKVAEGLQRSAAILDIIEASVQGPFLLGSEVRWPDLFLIPILSDLNATVDSNLISSRPKLAAWFQVMTSRDSYARTSAGTLEAKQSKL